MPLRPSPLFPSFGHAVLLVVGTLILQVAGSGIVAAGWLAIGSPGTIYDALFNAWALSAVSLVAAGSALAYGRRATGETPASFYALRPFPPSLLPALVCTALGLAMVMNEVDNLIMEFLRLIPGFEEDNSIMFIMTRDAVGAFILLVLVAPFAEEYLFRGLILRGLLRNHRPVIAVVLTAILFSLMHANLRQLFLAFVIGAVFGWWAVRTRSVAPGIIGHAVFNSVAYAASQLPDFFESLGFIGEGESGAHQAWWLTLGGVAMAALGCWWFHLRALTVIPPPPPAVEPPPIEEPPLLPIEVAPVPIPPPAPPSV